MLPEAFIRMLPGEIGPERAQTVLSALSGEPSVSIRLNPSKTTECPFPDAGRIPWSPYGYLLKERPVFTLDPLFHAGCYYVQDSSAMFVGELFRRALTRFEGPGLCVLDLCAAPGGKTTDLAASLRERFGDGFSLLANEVMRNRFGVLRSNVRTWGDPRVGVVSRDPSAFSGKPVFDLIVADVPCSGEGMFRKDEKAVEDWSPEAVAFCAARQRRILSDVWSSLKPGGVLVYSTCTFNRQENDGNVAWIASELGADILDCGDSAPVVRTEHGYALLPGLVPGEGQYAAVLVKHGEPETLRTADVFSLFRADLPIPPPDPYPAWDLDRETALQYLHGDAIRIPDAPAGLLTLTYQGHPLGPGKNLGSRCNNLYPKDRRIRMDIR
jgi:16S rRNA C967 or C1407 C5-methylase (RsmB/RsmF family)